MRRIPEDRARRDVGGLAFLLAAACGAPGEALAALWEKSESDGSAPRALALAPRLGAAPALTKFFEGRAVAVELQPLVRRLAVASIRGEALRRAAEELFRELWEFVRPLDPRAVVLKGAALELSGVYRGEREYCDVDVLAPEEAAAAWRDAAARSGAAWKDTGEGHEIAYIGRGPAIVELHRALPAGPGDECGSGFAEVAPRAEPLPGWGGARAATGALAGEISAHHFLVHHGGDPDLLLRALQDLSRVGLAGAPRLDWPGGFPGEAAGRLARAAAALRSGTSGLGNDEVRSLLPCWGAVVGGPAPSSEAAFAGSVDQWLRLRRQRGSSRLGLIVERLREGGDGRGPLGRAASLLRRYARGSVERLASRPSRAAHRRWLGFLGPE